MPECITNKMQFAVLTNGIIEKVHARKEALREKKKPVESWDLLSR